MLFQNLLPSASLTVEHFADIDQFHAADLVGNARNLPLRPKEFSASRASLALPSCQLMLIRSFARILDSSFHTSGAFVIVPLGRSVEAVMNGVALDDQSLIFLSGTAAARSVEPRGNLHAIVNFQSPVHGRGWPLAENRLHLLKSDLFAIGKLSRTITDLFRFASGRPEHMSIGGVAESMQESLLTALDAVLGGGHMLAGPRSIERYARLVSRIDEILAMHPTIAPYSEDLARECGASVRTLQTAIATIRGASLHDYLRLRRFWSVRQRLKFGGPGLTIKACALANGFWHLGEFAVAYRKIFGESPTETLARAR